MCTAPQLPPRQALHAAMLHAFFTALWPNGDWAQFYGMGLQSPSWGECTAMALQSSNCFRRLLHGLTVDRRLISPLQALETRLIDSCRPANMIPCVCAISALKHRIIQVISQWEVRTVAQP